MQFKTTIAIFFSVIFFGKFLMLDAKALNSFLASEGIALVNPFCKKNDQGGAENIDFAEDSSVLIISNDALCNPQYTIAEKIEYQSKKKLNFQDFGYLSPVLISTYFSKNYPPPKELAT